MTERVLTGIKPTGMPHVGNLLGAIRPALRLAADGNDAMYFIADYHALISLQDAKRLAELTREVAATWLAFGLDPDRVTFYRQSDVPEIFELTWILTCFTSKGWMNKAHAYKAAVDVAPNPAEPDAGITMGLYCYPILMAADILAFDVDVVPVGKDQVQHIEIARDIAQRVNHVAGRQVLRLPRPKIDAATEIVPGTDGRKMSKSYDNTLPLFAPPKQLEKAIMRIVTDTLPETAPKNPDESTIFKIFRAVIGWGEAKKQLAERLERELVDARARYEALIADPAKIDALLAAGAKKARITARATLDRVRAAIGIAAPM
jgi:tryptophanyl-tRNA synthetase